MFGIGLFMFIFLVGTISAFEFDNVLEYSKGDLRVDFQNAFGLGSYLGTAELKSHPSVDYVLPVGYGKEEVVMYYDFYDWKDIYKEGLGEVYFTDKRTGKEIEKDYSFVYWGTEDYEIPTYSCKDELNKNGTITNNCVKNGTEIKTRETWLPYNLKEIPTKNIRIGLKTYVERNDYIDAVWTIAGKEVKKHASWNASNEVGLVAYYDLNEESGTTADDYMERYDGTTSGATVNQTGKIKKAYSFDGTNDYVDLGNIPCNSSMSISVWVYMDDMNNNQVIIGKSKTSSHIWRLGFTSAVVSFDVGSFDKVSSTVGLNAGEWYHVVGTFDGDIAFLYVNGELNNTRDVITTIPSSSNKVTIGANDPFDAWTDYLAGDIDEVGIWDRNLSASEVSDLWNDGSGISPTASVDNSPNITLNSPEDYYNSTNPNVVFNCTPTDDINVDEVYLYLNGALNDTESSPTNNTATTFSVTLNASNIYQNWTCGVCDNSSQCTNGSIRYLNISESPDNYPSVTLSEPVDYYNTTNSSIGLSCKASDDLVLDTTRVIFNGGEEHVNNTPINDSYMNVSVTLSEGLNNWTCEACDNSSQCTNASLRYLTLDTQNPTLEVNLQESIIYNYGDNVTLNYTITDDLLNTCWYQYNNTNTTFNCESGVNGQVEISTVQGYTEVVVYVNDSVGHLNYSELNFSFDSTPPTLNIIFPLNNTTYYIDYTNETITDIDLNWTTTDENLDTCWYFNGTGNTTINCGEENTTLTLSLGTYTFKVYANDTLGNFAEESSTVIWDYTLLENSITYNEDVVELSQESYVLNVSYNPSRWTSIKSTLVYDNTNYSTTITGSGINKIFTTTFSVPAVDEETNKTFNYIIRLTNSTGEYFYNTTSYSQSVGNIGIDNCLNYTTKLYNLTLRDEKTQELLNGDIEVSVIIYGIDNEENQITYSTLFEDVNNSEVCLDTNLTENNLYLNTMIKYSATDFQKEYYNIQKYLLNSSSVTQDLTLYDLNSTSATVFDILYKGSNFLPVEDAIIIITKKFVAEGVFKTVEIPITDIDGKTTASLEKDNEIYTFNVYKYGEFLASFQNVIPVCNNELTGDCEINLNAVSSPTQVEDFETLDDLTYQISWDEETKIIDLTYSIPTGEESDINLLVYKFDSYSNDTICDVSVSSASGSLNCVIPDSYTNQTAIINIYKNGVFINTYSVTIEKNPIDFFGYTGLFLGLIIMITIPLMFITSLIGVVIGMMIGVIMLSLLFLSNGANIYSVTGGIIWFIIAGIILIWKLNNTERRG